MFLLHFMLILNISCWLLCVIYFILTALIFIHQVRGKKGTLTSEPNFYWTKIINISYLWKIIPFKRGVWILLPRWQLTWKVLHLGKWGGGGRGRERNGNPSLLSTKFCRMVQNGTLTIVWGKGSLHTMATMIKWVLVILINNFVSPFCKRRIKFLTKRKLW